MTTAPAEAGAANAEAGQAIKRAPSTVADIETRTGDLIRGVIKRTTIAGCLDCIARFGNIGAATSHARSARHRVQATYSATYIYLPAETLPGGAR